MHLAFCSLQYCNQDFRCAYKKYNAVMKNNESYELINMAMK
jgi:hypothetical protein